MLIDQQKRDYYLIVKAITFNGLVLEYQKTDVLRCPANTLEIYLNTNG